MKILRTGHEGDLQSLERRPLGALRLKLLLQRAWFVAVSQEARAELESRGAAPGRIFDIPNGVDTETFHPASPEEKELLRDRLGLARGNLILYTGRLQSVKRIDILVRAMVDVPAARLVVVGDGPERDKLEALGSEIGLSDRVVFVGNRTNVADYLRAADIFATPSDSEGLSNSLLEAMAVGLACVAAPASAVEDLLAEERGVLVESAESAAWGSAINGVLADGDLMRRLGSRAADHVACTLTIATTADKLVAAYRHISGRGTPKAIGPT